MIVLGAPIGTLTVRRVRRRSLGSPAEHFAASIFTILFGAIYGRT